MSLRTTFGTAARRGRLDLDLSQQELAKAVSIHRGHLANIEAGRVNVSVDQMSRIADALGLRLELVVHPPRFVSVRPHHDTVHAWCSGYVTRRLTAAEWLVAREVDVSEGQVHGWIDLAAFDPRTATLVLIEIKSRLDDFGAAERQIGWYERHGSEAARRLGWRPRHQASWLLALASDEIELALRRASEAVDHAFPGRSDAIQRTIAGEGAPARRALALIDPASRRRAWLLRTRLDGRRSAAPYRGYADAADRAAAR